jgi:hypothetical protein
LRQGTNERTEGEQRVDGSKDTGCMIATRDQVEVVVEATEAYAGDKDAKAVAVGKATGGGEEDNGKIVRSNATHSLALVERASRYSKMRMEQEVLTANGVQMCKVAESLSLWLHIIIIRRLYVFQPCRARLWLSLREVRVGAMV